MVPVNFHYETGVSQMSDAEKNALPSLPTWPEESSVKLYQTYVDPQGNFTQNHEFVVRKRTRRPSA